MFQGHLKDVSNFFLNPVSRGFKGVSIVFQGCFEVSLKVGGNKANLRKQAYCNIRPSSKGMSLVFNLISYIIVVPDFCRKDRRCLIQL